MKKKARRKSLFPSNVHDIRITVEKEEGFSKPGALILTLGVVVLLGMYWLARPVSVEDYFVEDYPVICTQEARLCPDGSSVGRIGPNCAFAACPGVSPSISPVSSIDTSNWKTYRNEKYGFEVKYPVHLQFTQDEYSFVVADSQTDSIYFDLYITEADRTLKQYAEDQAQGSEINGPKEIKKRIINGIAGFEIYGHGSEGHRYVDTFYFEKSNFIWAISLDPVIEKRISKEDNPDEFYQMPDGAIYTSILSAFKFIKVKDEKMSCEINADCTVLLCSGAVSKEWAKNAPPEPPCAQYEGYIAQCTEKKCTAIKP